MFPDDTSSRSLTTQELVGQWDVTAIGHRPTDYLARDFLFGSLFRDKRPRWFHKYTKEPPRWLNERARQLHGRDRAMALQMAALAFFHYRHLLEVAQLDPGAEENAPPSLAARLLGCPPIGVLVDHTDGRACEGEEVCRLRWLCPWCQGRSVVDLYERLGDRLPDDAD